MKKRLVLGLLAVLALVVPTTAASASPTSAPSRPLPVVQQLAATVPVYAPERGIKMGIHGLFERPVRDTGRTAKVYVPQDAVLGAYMVVTTVPQGQQTVQWLVDSGWMALADRDKFVVYILEPGAPGSWGTAAEEQSYVQTAYDDISVNGPNGRGTWYLPPESYYVVGYGAAGTALQKTVMKDPTLVAAAAFVNASDIGSDYLAQMQTTYYATPDWNGQRVASSSVPLPVWTISDHSSAQTAGVVDYWKHANQTVSKAVGFHGGQIFRQQKGTLDYYVADESTAVAVLEKRNLREDARLNRQIYESFLSDYTRYGGAVGGNTLGTRPDYRALGVEYRTMELDGRLREFLVYVPHKARVAAARGEKSPVVFSLHGSGMTMYSMFDFSRWWEVADDEGFILVVPTGLNTENRTGWALGPKSVDMTYMQRLLDTVKQDYAVDTSRIYLGGQSMGSMMSNAIARDLTLSKNFTALGTTSGVTTSNDYSGEVLPNFMLFGEFDFWPYDPATSTVGGWATYWINRNKALGTPTTPASLERDGRYVMRKWNNAEGVNVVRYGVTLGRGHSIIPSEMRTLWDWYALWQKDASGNNVYVGP
ncbi:putative esterase [Humibacillus xanthopallidus]|uniref:Putative esterase n=1 Tax=Humibacillus xanthopallidus TaxID=412689 RepID=A0A543PQJ5_9MICO|nr:alpha/beta hydrolase-fold protein [Humibacillus xanthopallidus]TQN46334.1 putative esterase [Humibacillus xanthopallidus]